jgi:acetyl-CoA C-acetyltransferase
MTKRHPQLPDNTPIIIGAAQHVERIKPQSRPHSQPPFSSPMDLAATASGLALKDAGVSAADTDTIAVIRLFSDAVAAWASPFGGSNNPPESIARRIGASPSHRIYSNVGGTEPLQMLRELLDDIARGEKTLALLTGTEAIASQRFAVRNGYEANWREEFDVPFDNRDNVQRLAAKQEIACGVALPVRSYALIENAQAHRMGHTLRQHQQFMAELMAPFSAVAASNPYSQWATKYSTAALTTQNPDNYPISLPYSKRFVAQDAVNQSAALVLTSVGNARRLGVDPRQWVFLESYAQGADRFLSEREDIGRSVAMERVLNETMNRAEATCADMDMIDIYSCFPCAVQAACEVLDLPTDGSRSLTVTGGLPYFGGPGNNYCTHALAEVALRLRGKPTRALVTGNGGMLYKHAAAVLTSDGSRAAKINWGVDDVFTVASDSIPARPLLDQAPHGAIVSYTVVTRRDKDDIGMILAETPTGERFLASSTEPAITGAMADHSPIGRAVNVSNVDERSVFSFGSE